MNVITKRRHMNYCFPNAFDLLIANKNTWLKLALEFTSAKLEGIYHDHRHQQLGNILCDVDFDFYNHD